MKQIGILTNTIQNYAWGSHKAIADLLGKMVPSEQPEAELWMGTHPKGASLVEIDGRQRPLPELIAAGPLDILGQKSVNQFGPQLPYLFKVLAAERPLSIQAHPNREQARSGYQKENALGIPLDSPQRNYKDPNHKPECICALTPFWGMNGFRPVSEIIDLIGQVCPQTLADPLRMLERNQGPDGLKVFFESLIGRQGEAKEKSLKEALFNAAQKKSSNVAFEWIVRLARDYPQDIGILGPAFLNLVCLQPGEAMFLAPGKLHAYLEGVGIELMANSDNVLRGGLTPKHVDVAELMAVLDFSQTGLKRIIPQATGDHEMLYPCPAEEFRLSIIRLENGDTYTGARERSAEILLCIEGGLQISVSSTGQTAKLSKGVSVIVPAAVPTYRIKGAGTLYKASVPL